VDHSLFWNGIKKYAECLLSLNFRTIHEDGSVGAGPMYYLEKGLEKKWLGVAFAFFATIASFGIGNMVQANSVAEPLLTSFGVPKIVTGVIIAVLCFMVIVGGIKRIGNFASKIVPIMSVFYIISVGLIIFSNLDKVGPAFATIFGDAFTGSAATGGFTGSVVASFQWRSLYCIHKHYLFCRFNCHRMVVLWRPLRELSVRQKICHSLQNHLLPHHSNWCDDQTVNGMDHFRHIQRLNGMAQPHWDYLFKPLCGQENQRIFF